MENLSNKSENKSQFELENELKLQCSLNHSRRVNQIIESLIAYWGISNPDIFSRLQFIEAINLLSKYKEKYNFLEDSRLAGIMIVIIPDDLWHKGRMKSESYAEHEYILFQQSSFEGPDNPAWMVHELAHCQKFKNAPEEYERTIQTFAYKELNNEYPYPNNLVEKHAFTQQFRYLLSKKFSQKQIINMLKTEYGKDSLFNYQEDFLPFFNKIFDEIFK